MYSNYFTSLSSSAVDLSSGLTLLSDDCSESTAHLPSIIVEERPSSAPLPDHDDSEMLSQPMSEKRSHQPLTRVATFPVTTSSPESPSRIFQPSPLGAGTRLSRPVSVSSPSSPVSPAHGSSLVCSHPTVKPSSRLVSDAWFSRDRRMVVTKTHCFYPPKDSFPFKSCSLAFQIVFHQRNTNTRMRSSEIVLTTFPKGQDPNTQKPVIRVPYPFCHFFVIL